ncbi:uracil-DNA glycosylase [Candidatus Saccharibacteria bacterium]|nr:uracil-DNA glycosylase [Candidatus Saccharibacteria bacterium]
MHESWKPFLDSEFEKPYFKELSNFLHDAYAKKTIFPPKQKVFRAFSTDLNQVKVVILGQDPYHTPGAAHGLAFSVPDAQPIPPSLKNIYKEIEDEYQNLLSKEDFSAMQKRHGSGNLSNWQKQGVLMLHNVLTVEAHHAGSHRGHGWETFTEEAIKYLNVQKQSLVFLLWGRDARNKAKLIDRSKHLVLEAPHPSPLSAYAGFFGCDHFKKCNDYLKAHGLKQINW